MISAQRRHGLERLGRRPELAAPEPTLGLGRAPLPSRLPPIPVGPSPGQPLPDLLNATPALTVDAPALERVLSFSFVVGDDGGALASALDLAPIAASTFEPACFFEELFVEELLRHAMAVRIGGHPVRMHERYLLRLLSQPPSELAAVLGRRAVLRELAEAPDARPALEALYVQLVELRKLFEGEGRLGIRGEQARRRIDILEAVRASFDKLCAPAFARSGSHLQRLAAFGDYVRAGPGYERLSELLRYENERAYADLTVQLGADGTVRGLKLVGMREDVRSRYHVSPLQRWLDRLLMLLRGVRISEAEILDRWLDQVFEGVRGYLPSLFQLIGDLEFYLAGLAFHDGCRQRGLPVCFPDLGPPDAATRIEGLYNPLLFALDIVPVPCTVELGPAGVSTLVTGPNSGGKTRLLQAVGLLHLCAHAGLHAPAERATLPQLSGIFASLSQPSGAEQPEGRLGTELLRIRMLFERAEVGSLVLLDELCSGTSPSEGEELFRLVLELLVELAPTALISTHFLRLTASLTRDSAAPPLRFLQVELDPKQRPTYAFVSGVAETSLAKQTAARLGVTREELLSLVALKHARSR